MPANPAADFRGIDQPKNVGAERVPYPGRTRFCVRRMKAEPCFIGKASPVLGQQTKRQRTSREAVPVDYDSLTTQLQIQIFGDVLRDITATVIFDEYFAFGSIRVAGNSRKQQSNQQRPLRSLHGDSKLKVAVEMRSLYWAFIGQITRSFECRGTCRQYKTESDNMGSVMKKFLIAICSIILAIGVSGCVGKGPIGKGKAPPPPVVTRG
jgi:hypothetical protein